MSPPDRPTGGEDARPIVAHGRRGILVRLARSNLSVTVDPGETILEALQRVGIFVPHGCLAGTCGSCETRVLEGVPLHRDQIIDRRGPERLTAIMICCSRALSAELVLDL